MSRVKDRALPVVIFDLDGTLALCDHRRHFVEGEHKNWEAFYEACVDDTVNERLADLARLLYKTHQVFIWSGRNMDVLDQTCSWLDNADIPFDELRMRMSKDYTPDDVLKEQWLRQHEDLSQAPIALVFDDRDKVVAMWRRNGLICCQVAPGDF